MRRRIILPQRDRWDPGSLGPAAWWTADPRFVTLSSGNVSIWRNRIDGRSGVLIAANAPAWQTASGPAGRPAVQFVGADLERLDELSSGQPDGSKASDITVVSGLNSPFSLLMTVRPTSTAVQVLASWYSTIAANPRVIVELTSDNQLQVMRRDGVGGTLDIAGLAELGTSIRRIAITFDGGRIDGYVDGALDFSSSSFGTLGTIALDKFRVGDDDSLGTGADMYLSDLVILPRAATPSECLHYYEWSVKQWGKIQPPSFGAAGAGVEGTGDLDLESPTMQAGDRIYVAIGIRNIVNSPATPAGWSLVFGPDTNPGASLFLYERDTVATASESFAVNFTIAAGNNCNTGFIFTLKGVTATPNFSGRIENEVTTEVDGPGSLPGPTVSPNGYGRLAIAVVGVDTNQSMSFSGAAGGTWAASAEYLATTGSNFGLSVHVAPLPNAAPISGGSATVSGSDSAICRAFAVVGE